MINTEVLDHDLLLPMRGIGKKIIPFSGNCLQNLHAFFLPRGPFFISCLGGILRFRLTLQLS